MGMFDTIIFDQPIPCPKCGAEIRSDQTKAFATHRAEMFMYNVCEWFEGGYNTMTPEDRRSLRFIWHRDILDKSETPLAALRHFLAQRQAESGDEDEQMSL